MDIKAIRKLPELQENQEWACEGGCDVIHPKHFENVFSESFALDGSSIKRQSEFFWTCQNNHLLKVWCTDTSDYILLPEDFYQAEAPKVVESNSIQASIDLLDQDIESIKNSFLEESLLTNEEADTLEQLITKAMQLGEFYAIRDAKAQAVPKINGSIQAHELTISEIKAEIEEGYDLCQDIHLLDALVERGIQIGKTLAVPEGFVLVPTKKIKYFSNDGENYEIHDTLAEAKREAECAIEHFSERLADQLSDPRSDGNFQDVGYGVVLAQSAYSIDHIVTQDDIDNGDYSYEVGTEIMSLFLAEAQEQSHENG